MSYVDDVTRSDTSENVIYRAFISLWGLTPNLMVGVLCLVLSVLCLLKMDQYGLSAIVAPATLGFALLGTVIITHAIAVFYTTEIAITNKRIITKPGIISRNGTQLLLTKCESCNFKQSVMGRICNYGTVEVSGAGETNALIPGISNPMEFQNIYRECYRAVTEG